MRDLNKKDIYWMRQDPLSLNFKASNFSSYILALLSVGCLFKIYNVAVRWFEIKIRKIHLFWYYRFSTNLLYFFV